MDIIKLEKLLNDSGQPKYRLRQIKQAIYQNNIEKFSDIKNIPTELREKLAQEINILSFAVEDVLSAKNHDSIKALLKLNDGLCIETVLISIKPKTWSACISTQVGCALKCNFCATGRQGIIRNLNAEEITDQVLFWRQFLKKEKISGNFSNIVYMGMGEPLMNWENVAASLKNLMNHDLFGYGARSISVSTSGIPDKIIELGKKFPQINLALSLHFADDEKRSRYMPINRKYNLATLKGALEQYLKITKRKIFIEYIMLNGINDNLEDAKKLIEYLKTFKYYYLLHVNLISYNIAGNNYQSSSDKKIKIFRDYLTKKKIAATIRKSLGGEIKGACGQLAGQ